METTTFSAVLGVVLKEFRQQKNLEQQDLADALGISQVSYGRLERGISVFSVDQMFAASRAIGVSDKELMRRLTDAIHKVEEAEAAKVTTAKEAKNETERQGSGSNAGAILAGAALGALVIGLLSKSK